MCLSPSFVSTPCWAGLAHTVAARVQEVAESVDEFLALATTKYSVKSYLGPAPEFDVKKEYGTRGDTGGRRQSFTLLTRTILSLFHLTGPFACEYWGKVVSDLCRKLRSRSPLKD